MATLPICSYCGAAATLVTGARLYAHRPELAGRSFWECAACQAWVGCHTPRGDDDPDCPRPLGTLADASLRRWRNSAHALFDPIWRSGSMSRGQAYTWLAEEMGQRARRGFVTKGLAMTGGDRSYRRHDRLAAVS